MVRVGKIAESSFLAKKKKKKKERWLKKSIAGMRVWVWLGIV